MAKSQPPQLHACSGAPPQLHACVGPPGVGAGVQVGVAGLESMTSIILVIVFMGVSTFRGSLCVWLRGFGVRGRKSVATCRSFAVLRVPRVTQHGRYP